MGREKPWRQRDKHTAGSQKGFTSHSQCPSQMIDLQNSQRREAGGGQEGLRVENLAKTGSKQQPRGGTRKASRG